MGTCCFASPQVLEQRQLEEATRRAYPSMVLGGCMENLFIAADGSSTAWATAWPHRLGFVGVVNFSPAGRSFSSIRHECIRFRDTREQAIQDARSDACKLVKLWMEQVRLDDI